MRRNEIVYWRGIIKIQKRSDAHITNVVTEKDKSKILNVIDCFSIRPDQNQNQISSIGSIFYLNNWVNRWNKKEKNAGSIGLSILKSTFFKNSKSQSVLLLSFPDLQSKSSGIDWQVMIIPMQHERSFSQSVSQSASQSEYYSWNRIHEPLIRYPLSRYKSIKSMNTKYVSILYEVREIYGTTTEWGN